MQDDVIWLPISPYKRYCQKSVVDFEIVNFAILDHPIQRLISVDFWSVVREFLLEMIANNFRDESRLDSLQISWLTALLESRLNTRWLQSLVWT